MGYYLSIQLLAPIRSVVHAMRLVRVAPLEWLMMWLILNVVVFISVLTWFIFATSELLMMNLTFFIGIAHAAYAIDRDPELLYHNRGLDQFIASLNPDTRFFSYLFGLIMIIFAIAWGGAIHQLFNTWQGTTTVSTGILPSFLWYPQWQLAYVGGLMLCIWFTPMYLIYHGENILSAILFSLSGCLKNGLSWLILMSFFLLLAQMIARIQVPSVLWLVPVWSVWFMLLGISSYTHFRAVYPDVEDEEID